MSRCLSLYGHDVTGLPHETHTCQVVLLHGGYSNSSSSYTVVMHRKPISCVTAHYKRHCSRHITRALRTIDTNIAYTPVYCAHVVFTDLFAPVWHGMAGS